MRSEDIVAALRKAYAPPAWAFLEQVGDATGYGVSRHADGIAMSLWPSRGLTLHGFEVKVSRSDWKRELAKPGKAEPIATYCDFWAIVAPVGIVPINDVPTTWGLVELDAKGRLITTKKPERLLQPAPLDRGFLAAVLRRASASTPTLEMQAEAQTAAIDEAKKYVDRVVDDRTAGLRAQLQTLQARVRDFETELGIPLENVRSTYASASGKDFARAVRYVAEHDTRELLWKADQLERIAAQLSASSAELRAVGAPEPDLEAVG